MTVRSVAGSLDRLRDGHNAGVEHPCRLAGEVLRLSDVEQPEMFGD